MLRSTVSRLFVAVLLGFSVFSAALAVEAPKLVQKDGRFALMVEGKPFLMLGGQIHNSSAWPSELPQVWKSMEALHANTVEAPAYWEQIEAEPGKFDFSVIDAVIEGARAHHLHMVLLWFGTWKNGNMHYVPSWVKADSKKYPRTVRPDGEPIDVLSPIGQNTLAADKAAFTALTKHLQQFDGEQHTILAIQVENESGNVGSVRDNSAEANKLFAGPVPADLLKAAGKSAGASSGTWSQVFGSAADETFQVYYQSKYINEIAAAGKAQFNIPYYVNVWVDYPRGELPQRQISDPGVGYPSGGPVQKMVGLWRALAPSLDAVGPDIYSDDSGFYRQVVQTYHRPDNPLWIPETGRGDSYGKYFYYALGEGAVGFAPFGVDESGWNILVNDPWKAHSDNFALIGPMSREIAQWNFEGKLKTLIEEPGQATQEIDFGPWQATVAYGYPQNDGRRAPGTKDAHGAALVVQLGPDEFLVTGVDASVVFHLPGKMPWIHSEMVTVEQGTYENGVWKPVRLWNGDETDRGLSFHQTPEVVKVKMGKF